jgi:hypothetical protein
MAVTTRTAISFVKQHGVVLESSRGPAPNLAEAVAGSPIRGSWWGHRMGHAIFAATRAVRESEDVLVCRLVRGRVTYVHRRLWPALVRLAHQLDVKRLAAIREEHTASGAHRLHETPFVDWVPAAVENAAAKLSEEQAFRRLGKVNEMLLFIRAGRRRTNQMRKTSNARAGARNVACPIPSLGLDETPTAPRSDDPVPACACRGGGPHRS